MKGRAPRTHLREPPPPPASPYPRRAPRAPLPGRQQAPPLASAGHRAEPGGGSAHPGGALREREVAALPAVIFQTRERGRTAARLCAAIGGRPGATLRAKAGRACSEQRVGGRGAAQTVSA